MRSTLRLAAPAALLAACLAAASWVTAGSVSDTDGDLVPDAFDNCLLLPNGPNQVCNQMDGDLDGYGNGCDFDTNNDGATGIDDVAGTLAKSAEVSTDPNFDFNCDGGVGLDDFSQVLNAAATAMIPGPSGLACAGTVPCLP